MAKRELLPGVVLALGGRDYVVPPLTLGQMGGLSPRIAALGADGDVMDERAIDAIVAIVGAAKCGATTPILTMTQWPNCSISAMPAPRCEP